MALIIEDGSGIPNADSYGTVAAWDEFSEAFFGSGAEGTTGEKEAALRRAARYMDRLPWKGVRTNGREQGLSWPRAGVRDYEGQDIADDEIPREVKEAQFVLARAELQSPGILSPTVVQNEGIKRERIGPIETEYADPARSVEAFRPIVTQAMDMLEGLVEPKRATIFLERA